MQAFPVNNLHSHAQPILAYLRLLGVQPTSTGALKVGSGGSFSSQSFEIRADGHGRLRAGGAVEVHSDHGVVRGSAGTVSW